MKRLIGIALVVALAAGCSEGGRTDQPGPAATTKTDDACDLLVPALAEDIFGPGAKEEGYESDIGPGCVYEAGERRLGMNLEKDTFRNVRHWREAVVNGNVTALTQTRKPTVEKIQGVGDGASWVTTADVQVLYVLSSRRAFDIYIELGPRAGDEEMLDAAIRAARSVMRQLERDD